MDESTDNANKEQLLLFILFIDEDQIVNQFFLQRIKYNYKG